MDRSVKGMIIGGPTPGERNVISGNLGDNIYLRIAHDITIEGNYIGTNALGTEALLPPGMRNDGIRMHGVHVVGWNTVKNNVISGHRRFGFFMDSPPGQEVLLENLIIGNYIGVAADGAAAVPNGGNGVQISRSSTSGHIIGGLTTGSANKICNNDGHGVCVNTGSYDNTIVGNVITYNGYVGVSIEGAGTDYNTISQNTIYGNRELGIDLGSDGVTGNYEPDAGPNEELDFPVIEEIITNSGQITVNGTAPGGSTVELFLIRSTGTPEMGGGPCLQT